MHEPSSRQSADSQSKGPSLVNRHAVLAIALLGVLILVLGTGESGTPDPSQPSPSESLNTTDTAMAVAEAGNPEPHTPELNTPKQNTQETSADSLADTAVSTGVSQSGGESSASDIAASTSPKNRLVIILDDIGNNLEAGLRAVALPAPVTLAVLPFTPHGRALAEAGHKAGKEIMLHAPMSNLGGMDLGPWGLTLDLDQPELLKRLRMAMADIPHIQGINNHTGSELTAAAEPMQWIMQELKERQLYFVDSMTTSKSVAAATAGEMAVPHLRRHVFLDNVAEEQAIAGEFARAVAIAQRDGFAVAIGHPYPATLDFLEQILPELNEQGIEVVSVSAQLDSLL